MLPEFADGGTLPAATGLGAAFELGNRFGELLPDVGGHGRARTLEPEPAFEFIGQEGEIQGLTVRQDVGQELAGLLWPVGTVIAAGGLQLEVFLVQQPLMAQAIQPAAFNPQPFSGSIRIQQTRVKAREDFLDKQR
jgi:hypothetical protein